MLRISAVIPCHNGAAYLEEALASVAAQTRPVQEVVVVDDASTDGSGQLAERLGATVYRHPANRGEGAARNTGWRAASGDAIAWLDADDRWRPHHVEVVAALLERHPGAAGAFGAVQCFGLNDQTIFGFVPTDEPALLVREAFHNWLHLTIGAITRRQALAAVGGFEERERSSVDFDLWLRLSRHHRFIATTEVTADWRWHEGQQSTAPLAQLLAVHRYRRRFIDALRAGGDDELAARLQSELLPAWTAHVAVRRDQLERRSRRQRPGPRGRAADRGGRGRAHGAARALRGSHSLPGARGPAAAAGGHRPGRGARGPRGRRLRLRRLRRPRPGGPPGGHPPAERQPAAAAGRPAGGPEAGYRAAPGELAPVAGPHGLVGWSRPTPSRRTSWRNP